MGASVKTIKAPFAAIKTCPACNSGKYLRLRSFDLVCACGWDSSEAFVESGAMDILMAAWERSEVQRLKTLRQKRRRGADSKSGRLNAG